MKRNMTKILSIAMVLAVLITLCVVLGVPAAAEANTYVVTTEAELADYLADGICGENTLVAGDILDIQADLYMGKLWADGTPATVNIDTGFAITLTSSTGNTIYRGAAETFDAVTIEASTPLFTIANATTVTVTNITVDGQKSLIADAKSQGGAFNVAGALIIEDGAVLQNFNVASGGAAYASGTVEMNGGTIQGNASSSNSSTGGGGGIFGTSASNITISGGLITGNSAIRGGGVFPRSHFTMDGGEVSGNTASKFGGGIFFSLTGGKYAKVTGSALISGNKVTGTSASDGGGGIALASDRVTISGGTITDNTAGSYGGGVLIANGGRLTVSDGIIGCAVPNCTHTADTCGGNAAKYGAGIAAISNSAGDSVGMLTMTGGTVIGNKATAAGGGIYCKGGASAVSTHSFSNCTISHNTTATYGGGLYLDSYTETTIGEGTSIIGNTASVRGGGINLVAALTMNDGVISQNIANCSSSNPGGGGIYVTSAGSLTINGGTIGCTVPNCTHTDDTCGGNKAVKTVDSQAGNGGGLNIGGILNFNGGSIVGNKADSNGGGIYKNNSTKTFVLGAAFAENGSAFKVFIDGNTATNGGGIYDNAKKTLTVNDTVSIRNNTATTAGGALYSGGTVFILGGELRGNKAVTGGAAYAKGTSTVAAKIQLSGGEIVGNMADGSNARGGAFFLGDYGTLYMTGGKLKDNVNKSQYGGGMQVNGTSAAAYIFGGEISGNYIAVDGGTAHGNAINISKGTVYLAGGSVYRNISPTQGYNDQNVISLYSANGILRIGTPAEAVTLPDGTAATVTEPLYLYDNPCVPVAFPGGASNAQVKFQSALTAKSLVFLPSAPTREEGDLALTDDILSQVFITDGVTVSKMDAEGAATVAVDTSALVADAANADLSGHVILKGGVALPAGTYTINGNGYKIVALDSGTGLIVPDGANITLSNATLDGVLVWDLGGGLTKDGVTDEIRTYSATVSNAEQFDAAIEVANRHRYDKLAITLSGDIYMGTASHTITMSADIDGEYKLIRGTEAGGDTVSEEASMLEFGGSGTFVTITGVSMDGADIADTVTNGGAVFVVNGAKVKIANGIIENFHAANGGAIFGDTDSTVVIDGTATIQNNVANESGGAIYAQNVLVIDGATITGNKALFVDGGATYGGGGAIYLAATAEAKIGATTFGQNGIDLDADAAARQVRGGAIRNFGHLTLTGCEFNGNYAASAGDKSFAYGGALHNKGTVIANNCTFKGNIAFSVGEAHANRGGAVSNDGTFVMNGGSMKGNIALGTDMGGALYSASGAHTYIIDGVISDNALARTSGGKSGTGILVGGGGSLYLAGGTVENNIIRQFTSEAVTNDPAGVPGVAGITFDSNGYPSVIVASTGAETYTITVTDTVLSDDDVQIYSANATTSVVKAGQRSYEVDSITYTATMPVKVLAGDQCGGIGGNASITLNGLLTADDYIVVSGSDIPLDGVTPDDATLAAIKLIGADTGFLVGLTEDNTALTWGDKDYQIVRQAGLHEQITFRISFFFRTASARKSFTEAGLTFNGVKQTPVKDDGGIYYEIDMAPKDILDPIAYTLGEPVNTDLKGYIDDLIAVETERMTAAGEDTSTLLDFLNSILYYCSAAQVYFGGENVTPAVSDYNSKLPDIGTINIANTTISAAHDTIKFKSAKILLNSRISLRVVIEGLPENYTVKAATLTVTGEGENEAVTSADTALAVVRDGATATVYLSGQSPLELSKQQAITIVDESGNDVSTLTYGLYNFIDRTYTSASTENRTLLKAIYYYAECARLYAGN